jgi:hypothetical protein
MAAEAAKPVTVSQEGECAAVASRDLCFVFLDSFDVEPSLSLVFLKLAP